MAVLTFDSTAELKHFTSPLEEHIIPKPIML